MAVFATTISINQDAFTFYDLVEYFYDQGFQDDFNATGEYTISGHTFEAFVKDSYYVQFQIDEQIYSTAFISETDITIIYNESDLISVSGTVNTIGTVDLEFGSPLYGITGINVDFADLFEVILTPTSSDDLSIIRDMLIGDDTFYLSDQSDLARGFDGSDIMYGYSGDDTLDGGDGDDTIYGGDGDDQLEGGTGNNVLTGGLGSDTYVYAYQSTDTVFDSGGLNDTLYVTSRDQDNVGYFGDSYVQNGNLVLVSRQDSSKSLTVENAFTDDGRIENITFHADSGAWEDLDYRISSLDDNFSGENILYFGTRSDDILVMNDGYNEAVLSAGNDTVTMGDGGGWVFGGDGDDIVTGGDGDDTIYGGDGDDTYVFEFQGIDTIK